MRAVGEDARDAPGEELRSALGVVDGVAQRRDLSRDGLDLRRDVVRRRDVASRGGEHHLLLRGGGVVEIQRDAAEAAGGRLPVIRNEDNKIAARYLGQHILAHLQGADAEA